MSGTPTITIDTDKTCTLCGKSGTANGSEICLECGVDMIHLSGAERAMLKLRQSIFADDSGALCPKCRIRSAIHLGPCLQCCEDHLRRGKPISTKHLPDFWPAELSVINLLKSTIHDHHPEAAKAEIGIMFRRKHGNSNGKITLGTCAKQSAKNRLLTGFDYIIELAWDMWCALNQDQRAALMLHELFHVFMDDDGQGGIKWALQPHDVEEFGRVIEKYGLWKPDLEAFAKSIERWENGESEYKQLSFSEFSEQNDDDRALSEEMN